MKARSAIHFDAATGQMVDTATGAVIRPGDPRWRPEWATVLADLRAIPAGYHYEYPDGGDHRETRRLVRNDVPWYRDPALLGAIALPVAAPAILSAAAGGAAAGAGAATLGPSTAANMAATSAAAQAVPAGVASAGGASAGVAGAAGAAGSGAHTMMGLSTGDLVKGGLDLFGSLFGAHQQTSAANRAAEIQAAALKYSADQQAQATAEALAFQKEQARRDYLSTETNRRANYDQWAAREARLGNTLGVMLGLGPRDIPAYVPLAPGTAPTSAAPGASGSPASSALPPVPKDLQTAIAEANKIAYGGQTKHTDPSYWAAHWAKDPGYTWQRLLGWQAGGADTPIAGPYAGAAASAAPAARPTQPYGSPMTGRPLTIGSYAQLAPRSPLTPALEASVYQPRTLGSYF